MSDKNKRFERIREGRKIRFFAELDREHTDERISDLQGVSAFIAIGAGAMLLYMLYEFAKSYGWF